MLPHEVNMIMNPYKTRDLYGPNEAGGGEEACTEESNEKLGFQKRSRHLSGDISGHSTKACSKQTSATHLNLNLQKESLLNSGISSLKHESKA